MLVSAAPALADGGDSAPERSKTKRSLVTDVGETLTAHRASSSRSRHTVGTDKGHAPRNANPSARAQVGDVAAASLPAEPAEFISPQPGATVAGSVAVSVTSKAERVRFYVDALPGGVVEAPVVSGTASAHVAVWGLADYAQIRAEQCVGSECSDAVSLQVWVENAPVSIQAPASKAEVGTSFVLRASSAGGRLRVDLDGAEVDNLGAPYDATISTASVSSGTRNLRVVQCDASGQVCDGPSASRNVVVRKAYAPTITNLSPVYFSPNGDGIKDATKVTYKLRRPAKVKVVIRNADGGIVRGPVSLGNQSSGKHSWTYNGRAKSGNVLKSATYSINIQTTTTITGSKVPGKAARAVHLDRTKPRGSAGSTLSTVFPAKDGYRDSTKITGHASEPVSVARAQILSKGKVRWTSGDAGSGDRYVRATWKGRYRSGKVFAPGTYQLRYRFQDRAGNVGYSRTGKVHVSRKHLVRKTGKRTVTPRSSRYAFNVGDCSAVATPARKSWPGSIQYLSNYYCIGDADYYEDYSYTRHAISLPRATRYGHLRVDTYGGRAVAGYADLGAMQYITGEGDITYNGATLRSTHDWYRGQTVNGADYVTSGHRFRWSAGTRNGNYYEIKSFKVSYTYYLLR